MTREGMLDGCIESTVPASSEFSGGSLPRRRIVEQDAGVVVAGGRRRQHTPLTLNSGGPHLLSEALEGALCLLPYVRGAGKQSDLPDVFLVDVVGERLKRLGRIETGRC